MSDVVGTQGVAWTRPGRKVQPRCSYMHVPHEFYFLNKSNISRKKNRILGGKWKSGEINKIQKNTKYFLRNKLIAKHTHTIATILAVILCCWSYPPPLILHCFLLPHPKKKKRWPLLLLPFLINFVFRV